MIRLLAGAATLYAGICVLAFLMQRRLLYFPDHMAEEVALSRAARLGLSPWRDERGTLRGWRAVPDGPIRARLLVLHGNAGSALDRAYYPAALVPHGLEVILFEYPGYGSRPGSPSLEALSSAAAEAVGSLAAEGPEPVWLLGESLGSGVASRAVALRPGVVQALLLVTPFARLTDVVRTHYPFLPSFLLRDRYEPVSDLAGFVGPALVLIAGQDEVVSAGQGRLLFEALRGPKRLVVQEGSTHNGLDLRPGLPLWREAVAFLLRPGG